MDDEEFLAEHIKDLEASVLYFSPRNKREGELWIAESFVENLRIPYTSSEFGSSADEPPDVDFRDARFEIKEILDEGRRPHDGFRAELERVRTLTKAKDVFRHFTPKDICLEEIYSRCKTVIAGLSIKYPPAVMHKLDLLLYVNLVEVMYVNEQSYPDVAGIAAAGWRSVSFVKGQRSCCLYARDDAPLFIRQAVGHVSHLHPQ
jgi:hypothetical protein